MIKYHQKISVLIILVFLLASCASAPRMEMSSSYYESDESLRALGRSENEEQNENAGRMIAYSVSMSLNVTDANETKQKINEQIENFNGFIVRESGNDVSARIPSERLDEFLTNIRGLGKIQNESKTGTDITDQYRDNVIRLDSLKNVRDRYIELLEKANSVIDILSIERELERVILEIERMEGRIRQAQLSVSYSLVSVRFNSDRTRPGPLGWIFYGLYRGIKWLFVWD